MNATLLIGALLVIAGIVPLTWPVMLFFAFLILAVGVRGGL